MGLDPSTTSAQNAPLPSNLVNTTPTRGVTSLNRTFGESFAHARSVGRLQRGRAKLRPPVNNKSNNARGGGSGVGELGEGSRWDSRWENRIVSGEGMSLMGTHV